MFCSSETENAFGFMYLTLVSIILHANWRTLIVNNTSCLMNKWSNRSQGAKLERRQYLLVSPWRSDRGVPGCCWQLPEHEHESSVIDSFSLIVLYATVWVRWFPPRFDRTVKQAPSVRLRPLHCPASRRLIDEEVA